MQYVRETPNASGAYPAPRSRCFPGCLPLTEGQAETLVQYNGFVTITQEPDEKVEGASVTVTPNTEAWESWKASLPPEPEPTPTLEERVSAVETGKAEQSDVDELNEALNMILTGVTE